MITNVTVLNDLLNRACDIITSMEGWILVDSNYYTSDLAKSVDHFFNDVDHLNEDPGPEYDSAGFTEEDRIVDGQYRNYVDTVKQNIDQAVADGILKSGTECMSYSYMSKEGFAKRMETDPEFAKQWENWLFPGEPLHDDDPEDKLEIVKTNISDLVSWLDENNQLGSIPDPIWKYIINIEKAVGIWNPGHTDPDAEAQDYNTFGNNKI